MALLHYGTTKKQFNMNYLVNKSANSSSFEDYSTPQRYRER